MKESHESMNTTDKAMETLMDAHLKEMNQRYGEDVHANIGWVTDERCVSSKMYGRAQVFSTCRTKKGRIVHKVEPY